MAKEANESRLGGEFVDRKTWRRIQDSMQNLSARDAQPYQLSRSFLSEDPNLLGVADQVLGNLTERGSLEAGQLRFTWLNESSSELLKQTGHENLKGLLEFSKQNDGTFFYGTMRMYGYENGEAEVILDAFGYLASQEPELGFEFSAFAQSVGLSKIWAEVYDTAGNDIEQRFTGRIDPQTSWSVAYALSQLDRADI